MSDEAFRPTYGNLPGWLRSTLSLRDRLFAPREGYLREGGKGVQQFFSAVIGYLLIAFLLAMVLPYWFMAGLRPTPELYSISAHVFHSTLGPWFSGLLFAAVFFMLIYRAESWLERLISWVAASAFSSWPIFQRGRKRS